MAGNELVALERDGWNALSGSGGADYYRDHLDENALMAFPFGVLDRQQALEAMASAAPWSRYALSEARVLRLGDDVATVIYRVRAQREGQPSSWPCAPVPMCTGTAGGSLHCTSNLLLDVDCCERPPDASAADQDEAMSAPFDWTERYAPTLGLTVQPCWRWHPDVLAVLLAAAQHYHARPRSLSRTS
jgi:hypothetical protein